MGMFISDDNKVIMKKMTKARLVKIQSKLDKSCEALEELIENGFDDDLAIFDYTRSLKQEIEEIIENKTRK